MSPLPDWRNNTLLTRSTDSDNSLSGTVAAPLQNGPIIQDDQVMMVYKISFNNTGAIPIGISVFAGDVAVPARRQMAQFTADALVPACFPEHPNPNSPIFILKPNSTVAPTQENAIYIGDGGAGGVITEICMSYILVRKG